MLLCSTKSRNPGNYGTIFFVSGLTVPWLRGRLRRRCCGYTASCSETFRGNSCEGSPRWNREASYRTWTGVCTRRGSLTAREPEYTSRWWWWWWLGCKNKSTKTVALTYCFYKFSLCGSKGIFCDVSSGWCLEQFELIIPFGFSSFPICLFFFYYCFDAEVPQ